MSEHQSWCMTWGGNDCTCQPAQEMASLKLLREGQMNILAAQDKLWQSLGAVERKLDTILGGLEQGEVWRKEYLAKLEEGKSKHEIRIAELTEKENGRWAGINTKLDAGLKGTADGVASAIADLRSWLVDALDLQRAGSEMAIGELRKDMTSLARQNFQLTLQAVRRAKKPLQRKKK